MESGLSSIIEKRYPMQKLIIIGLTILFVWLALTLTVEMPGPMKMTSMGPADAPQKALLVYDPDPFYNFDEQVCKAIAEVLADQRIQSTIATVESAPAILQGQYNIVVICANTYNWRPDWTISQYLRSQTALKGQRVIAITVGSGSTNSSQKALERLLLKKETDLIGSRSFWFLRPNDESRMNEKNVQVALSQARAWTQELVGKT
jgi:hypothetical protein